MIPPNLDCARLLRDSGACAVADLDHALAGALQHVDPAQHQELKLLYGRLMGEVISTLINPAIKAFPELEMDDADWKAIVECSRNRKAF